MPDQCDSQKETNPSRALRTFEFAKQKGNGGFAWWQKPASFQIKNKVVGVSKIVAKAVYLALCELDSDQGGRGTVIAGKALIAKAAECSPTSVKRAVKELERIGLIKVDRTKNRDSPGINDDNIYSLLPVSRSFGKAGSYSPQPTQNPVVGSLNDPVDKEDFQSSKEKKESGAYAPALAAADAQQADASSPLKKLEQPKPRKCRWGDGI